MFQETAAKEEKAQGSIHQADSLVRAIRKVRLHSIATYHTPTEKSATFLIPHNCTLSLLHIVNGFFLFSWPCLTEIPAG